MRDDARRRLQALVESRGGWFDPLQAAIDLRLVDEGYVVMGGSIARPYLSVTNRGRGALREAARGHTNEPMPSESGRRMILDLFAGAGGWAEGLRGIGLDEVGMEWDERSCMTRRGGEA